MSCLARELWQALRSLARVPGFPSAAILIHRDLLDTSGARLTAWRSE